MRLFIGIPLSSEVVDTLERISRSLRSANDNLRWGSPAVRGARLCPPPTATMMFAYAR
jgi:hypothetical protein